MRNLTKIATAVAVASGLALPASADYMAMDTQHVYMNVIPTISIGGGGGSSGGEPGGSGGACSGYAGSTDGICWSANVNMGDYMVGFIPWSFHFFVEANVQEVELACGATDLYKGNIVEDATPTDPHDDPILLFQPAGCHIQMDGATPAGGGSPVATFGGDTDTLEGTQSNTANGTPWIVYKTNSIPFHANFPEPSRNVWIDLVWNHDNPEQRIGEYSGFVKLYAMIPMPGV